MPQAQLANTTDTDPKPVGAEHVGDDFTTTLLAQPVQPAQDAFAPKKVAPKVSDVPIEVPPPKIEDEAAQDAVDVGQEAEQVAPASTTTTAAEERRIENAPIPEAAPGATQEGDAEKAAIVAEEVPLAKDTAVVEQEG